MEKNYMDKKFLDYSALLALVSAVKASEDADAADDLELIDMAITGCFNYVKAVDAGEQQILLASYRFEGDEYREMVSRYDTLRHNAHEGAISNVKLLNNLAKSYAVDPVFTGDITQRLEVADFCLDITVALFENRKL